MDMKRKARIGDLLVENNLINEQQLIEALEEQKNTSKKLGRIVVDKGFISERQLVSVLSTATGLPFIDIINANINAEIALRLAEIQARRHRALILAEKAEGYVIGMVDPTDLVSVDELKRILKKPLIPAYVLEPDLLLALDQIYRKSGEIATIATELESDLKLNDFNLENLDGDVSANEAPVVRLLQSILEDAVKAKASDIHIEPDETLLRVRYRIDGVLQEQVMKEKRIASALVLRLKIMAQLDISEKRLPQDGRFNVRLNDKEVDVRISTLPTEHGETVVMRLLDQSRGMLTMERLGMPNYIHNRVKTLIERPHGMILVTGPTGSGKTTTLYAALNILNTPNRKIITAEDPIEYRLPRVNQVQINSKIGLTFSSVLRSALRQDPDILLVGEMRDQETAEIGLRAAMTGHLVLSTLHTNDAPATALRLIDMGVDPYLVASALRAILAQRLVRRNCEHCRVPYEVSNQEKLWLKNLVKGKDYSEKQFFIGKGCRKCNDTGFSGRIGVYELLELDDAMSHALAQEDMERFSQAAYHNKYYISAAHCGLEYAIRGIISVHEVFKISASLEDRNNITY